MAQSQMMNNQHATMTSNSTVVASPGTSGQSRVNSQGISTKPMYQPETSQVSNLSHHQPQQQQHQMLSSSRSQKTMSQSDISHQYNSNMNNVPTQIGGSYQNVTGNALHFDLGLDNSKINLHQADSTSTSHQYQQSNQPPVQQTQQHYTSMSLTQQQHQQHVHQAMQQPHNQQHYFVSHGSQVHTNQSSQGSKKMSQSHSQIQHQLKQRSLHQQRYQKIQQQQPKQILQNTNHGSLSMSQEQLSSQPNSHSLTTELIDERNGFVEEILEDSGAEGDSEENDVLQSSEDTDNASENSSLANTKEKTPMCLINELARFNKTEHQYTLVDEQGPAHKKTFYVKLKLGEEEYSASGESIKKGQHAAAAIALKETKYKHPPPKPAGSIGESKSNITPTVELNALAMKRGEAVIYKAIEPQQPPYYQTGMEYRGLCNQRYHQLIRANRDPRYQKYWPLRYQYPRMSRAFYVSLCVGHREFIGDGQTRQAARHNAAQKALRILKNLPVVDSSSKLSHEQVEEVCSGDGLKSEISLVHEIALRRNMVVTFDVIRETGPAHMKNFLTRCSVSDIVTEGEGNSKKTSKKKAAELMLDELKKLPSMPTSIFIRPKAKNQLNKKKNRNIIKSEIQQQKADPNYGVGINPISRLIQIMQAQKKKEPVYTLVAERGMPRRREFIMQVEVEDKNCTGSGPNKKLAKRAAAEAMLQSLGYTKPSPQPTKSSIKHSSEGGSSNGDKKVTFVDTSQADGEKSTSSSASSVHHQRVPGLLHLPSKVRISSAGSSGSATLSPSVISNSFTTKEPPIDLSAILKPSWRPEQQLAELCNVLDYPIEIDDFAKKKPTCTEFISRISICVDNPKNPQNFHGSGIAVESARDMAALDALKLLVPRVKDIHPAGDGPQVKKMVRTIVGMKQDVTQK